MNAALRALAASGFDARRYRLLVDLFEKLGGRQEISVGNASFDMKSVLPVYFVMSALLSVFLVFARLSVANPVNRSPWPYLGIFIFVTVFFLFNFLLSEIANLLVNPVEGLALAHQPINGLTYVSAKLTHLCRFLVFGVAALNLIPALVPLFFLKSANWGMRWFYPLNHMVAAFTAVFFMALAMCCTFGLTIRLLPAGSLKGVSQVLQLLPIIVVIVLNVGEQVGASSAWVTPTIRRLVETFLFGHGNAEAASPVFVLLSVAVVSGMAVLAVRSLSMDYLGRVFSMVHGGSSRKVKMRRSLVGEWVTTLSRGQESRAGFEFVRRMMLRDWEFKRQVIPLIPVMFALVWVLARGVSSPFSASFSPVHIIPHGFGMALLWITAFLAYGSSHHGAWIFLVLSERAFRPFVRGAYLAIWLPFVLIPHLTLLPIWLWFWGAADAVMFVAFSAAIASLYLSLQVRLIEGIPFGRPPRAAHRVLSMALLSGSVAIAVIAVAIQHLVLFRSSIIVVIAIIGTGCASYVMTRWSLDSFENTVRQNLATVSGASSLLYREIE